MHFLIIFVRTPKKLIWSCLINPLSANLTKRSNTLKQVVGNLLTNCLSVLDHFVKLALEGLRTQVRTFKLKTLYKIKHIQLERKFRRSYKKRVNCFKIPSSNGDTQVHIVF